MSNNMEQDLKELNQKFDSFTKENNEFMTEIRVYMGKQTEMCKQHRELNKKMNEDISGNGKPGLKEEVRCIKQTIDFQKTITYIIIPIVLGLVIQSLWTVIFHTK